MSGWLYNNLLLMYKHILRGHKASSNSYIKWLRKKGAKIGEGVVFHDPNSIFIDTDKPYMITIGDNVHITHGVTIVAHGYDWIVLKNKYGGHFASAGEVNIGNNVFIGMNSTILKDVTIGDNVIIGAGSLVTKSLESNSVYGGVPARRIKSLDEYHEKRRNEILKEAVCAYIHVKERNVFDPEKKQWEFSWVYDPTDEGHMFESAADFELYCKTYMSGTMEGR